MSKPTAPTHITDATSDRVYQVDFSQIPIIDLGPMFNDDPDAQQRLAIEVRAACSNVGFFYVRNHGVAAELMRALEQQTQSFFDLPFETKSHYDIGTIGRHRGFVPVGALTAGAEENPDQQEGYEIALELPADDPGYVAGSKLFGPNVWPQELHNF